MHIAIEEVDRFVGALRGARSYARRRSVLERYVPLLLPEDHDPTETNPEIWMRVLDSGLFMLLVEMASVIPLNIEDRVRSGRSLHTPDSTRHISLRSPDVKSLH